MEFIGVDRPQRDAKRFNVTAAAPASGNQRLENAATLMDSPYSRVAPAAVSPEANAADQKNASFQHGSGSKKFPKSYDPESHNSVTKDDEPDVSTSRPAKTAAKGAVDVLRWTGEVPVEFPRVNVATRHGNLRREMGPPELEHKRLAHDFVTGPVDETIDAQSMEPNRQYQASAVPTPSGELHPLLPNALRSETRVLAAQAKRGAHSLSAEPAGKTPPSRQDGNKHFAGVIRDVPNSRPTGHIEQAAKASRSPNTLAQGLRPPPRRRPVFPVDGTSRMMTGSGTGLPAMQNDVYRADGVNARLATGHTPLTRASVNGERQAINVLLQRGADPNLPAQDHATALMYASWVGDMKSVDSLIVAGADPNRKNVDGKTALMAASRNGHADVVELLLKKGATPDQQTAKGWTAIMYAVWWGREDVTRVLLEYRANVGIRNRRGETAVDLATERKQTGIQALLR